MSSDRESSRHAAQEAFEEYLRLKAEGAEVDFEAICAERPEIDKGLRLLYSLHHQAAESKGISSLGSLNEHLGKRRIVA